MNVHLPFGLGIRVYAFVLLLGLSLCPRGAWASSDAPEVPPSHQAVMPLDEVRVGMKGYGLTVFHGTRIEPFSVEVVSVMRDFGPKRGVVWVRCPERRMQEIGPVQGMSGSPVYLWSEDEPHELGRGGRLLGAYAFGFGASKDCLVGVQPISLMRQAAGRVTADAQGMQPRSVSPVRSSPVPMLQTLLSRANRRGLGPDQTWLLRSLLRVAREDARPIEQSRSASLQTADGRSRVPQQAVLWPMAIRSASTVEVCGDLLSPFGIAPVQVASPLAGPMAGPVAGRPPSWIDPRKITLEPGSVLSIPLAYGDMDLSAVGTVTDVLTDGRVLGFGHAMFGQGPVSMPMASGYVHMIVPTVFGSFKLGGSGAIRGAIVRDENAAVVGTPAGEYTTTPIDVTVAMPDQPENQYHYEAVQHTQMTPLISTILLLESLLADRNLPVENSMRLRGQMVFTGGRTLDVDSLTAQATPFHLLIDLFPVMLAMMENPHQPMMLESMAMSIRVEPHIQMGSLVNVQLDRLEFEPGDTIGITLQIQPFGRSPIKRRIELAIPQGLLEGEYELYLCDASTYIDLLLETHPHLLSTTSVDDLYAVVKRLLSVSREAVYVVLQLPDTALAVGRQEMPRLPSSRRALLETSASTLAVPYREWVQQPVPMGMVVRGTRQFNIEIR